MLNRLNAIPSYNCHSDDFITINCEKTGRLGSEQSFSINEEFRLTATLSVEFWANSAQYERARVIAEKALVRYLYADVLNSISELRLAISNGQKDACFIICDRLEDKLTK